MSACHQEAATVAGRGARRRIMPAKPSKLPRGCLLKERSGTDPIMKTHHEADQITGQCGTPTFEIKDCPLHAQLVLTCCAPMPHLVLHSAPDPVIVSTSYTRS